MESDGFMVLGSWKENFLVLLEFDKIYSMQYLATYVNEILWNLFSKGAGGEVCGVCLPCHFFWSLLYEKDVISDIMVMSSVTAKQVWLLYLSDVLCSY